MSQSPSDLTSLVGSRICHDLISPLGAIANGIELLTMSGVQKSPELALISESVQNANARIKFFRVAYGAARSNQQIGRGEIVTILSDMSKGSRIVYLWEPRGDCIRSDVRIAFLLVQCLESAMPYGGSIRAMSNGKTWTLSAAADKMKFDTNLWESLSNPLSSFDHSAAEVHFALAPQVLAIHKKALKVRLSEAEIRVQF